MNENKLYIALFSIHGLIRARKMELGRDADTGGQIKYVVELADKLAADKRVGRVDLFTRKIFDSKVSSKYSNETEEINEKARIVRISCGPRRYLRKEVLWTYLDGFSDQVVQYFRKIGRQPDLIHGHYADAGYVGGQIARLLGVPFIFTGHSLGRVKQARLQEKGLSQPKMESRYNISRRIEAEEFSLDTGEMIVASTQQEIEEQYKLYEHYAPERMQVIPPGVDLEKFYPPRRSENNRDLWNDARRFLKNTRKPLILAMSRADERKNIEILLHAFGRNQYLRENTNLLLVAGNRADIKLLGSGAQKVMNNILYLIDKYDLYGSVAYPKQHNPEQVPKFYRVAAQSHGVFVNPALTEPFGLTLLEAAASGLPVVATNDGGPRDILDNCKNGLLINPIDANEIGMALQKLIQDQDTWRQFSRNGLSGVKKHYSWRAHVRKYLSKTTPILKRKHFRYNLQIKTRSRLVHVDRLLISDIDNTLLGNKAHLERLKVILEKHRDRIGFGIATGRRLDSAEAILEEWNVPLPDILITAVGSEINYNPGLVEDRTWRNHLNYHWNPQKVREVLDMVEGLELQPSSEQRQYKISYDIDKKRWPGKREVVRQLRSVKLKVKVIDSHDRYLDILPIRASKGLAVRYLAFKWAVPTERVLVAGDSGNDAEMLSGNMLGVIVGNYSSELKRLRGRPRIYFAEAFNAGGIMEGLNHYQFLGTINPDGEPNAKGNP